MGFNLFNPKTWFTNNIFDRRSQYEFRCDSNVLEYNPFGFYRNNPIVFTAIDERAKAISNFRFYIETEPATETTPAQRTEDDDLIRFLERPNPYQNRQDFLKSVVTFLSIYGNGYMYANKFVGMKDLAKQSLIVLDNQHLSIQQKEDWIFSMLSEADDKSKISKENEPVVRYRDPRSINTIKRLEFTQLMAMFDSPLTTNPLKVESRMRALLLPISNTQTAFESKNTLLSNPSGIGIVSSDASDANGRIQLTPTEHEEAETDLNLKNGTRLGQNAVRLVRTPVKFQNTAPKFKDMMLDESIVNDGLLIFGEFGLPKELYTALAKGSTFENQKEAFKRWLQTDGQVLADNIAATLNDIYKPTNGRLVASCDHLPAMQEDEKHRADLNKTQIETLAIKKTMLDDLLEKEMIDETYYKEQLNLV